MRSRNQSSIVGALLILVTLASFASPAVAAPPPWAHAGGMVGGGAGLSGGGGDGAVGLSGDANAGGSAGLSAGMGQGTQADLDAGATVDDTESTQTQSRSTEKRIDHWQAFSRKHPALFQHILQVNRPVRTLMQGQTFTSPADTSVTAGAQAQSSAQFNAHGRGHGHGRGRGRR